MKVILLLLHLHHLSNHQHQLKLILLKIYHLPQIHQSFPKLMTATHV